MSVIIYGSSDDLIEIEGDVTEEFYALAEYNNGEEECGAFLAFSDGTLLRIRYDEGGVWRITPVSVPQMSMLDVQQSPEMADDKDGYSDVATLSTVGRVDWVVLASELAVR